MDKTKDNKSIGSKVFCINLAMNLGTKNKLQSHGTSH